MKRRSIYELLEEVSKCKKTDEKIQKLREVDNAALRTILKYAFEPAIKFALPIGSPPYKPCQFVDQEARLYSEIRRLYLFCEGGNPNLSKVKRETLYIQLIESIDPNDAVLLNHVKDKKLPFKGITPKIVNEAFPNLITIQEQKVV
ncbi:MAG: hypothetical protein EBU08_07695 [Micrococcales bacterium]|nr:hypothetical protein [Micrococcales bacterium]